MVRRWMASILALMLMSWGWGSAGMAAGTPGVSVEGEAYPLTVTDYEKNVTVLEKRPERVAVISSATLNIWYDMGGKSLASPDVSRNVVLDPAYEEEIRNLPSLGAYYAMSLEQIVALQADLYIMQTELRATAAKLRGMGLPVIVTGLKNFEDVCTTYRAFGRILEDDARAEAKIAKLEGEKRAITDRLPEESKSVVILYLTANALSVKLNHSIAGDLANILNLNNIAANLPPDTIGSENTPLDIEFIVQEDPDLVLVTSMVADNETAVRMMNEHFANSPAWKGVAAVREGRVVYLPQEYFLVNAGPFYGDAIAYIAQCVYPEIYGESKE